MATIEYDSLTEDKLLELAFAYKNLIEKEPDAALAGIFKRQLVKVRLALVKKEKAALQSS